ncbi:MAG: hypothetical protein ACE5K8_09295 [Candidatus Zixiibacteriota bacterium]
MRVAVGQNPLAVLPPGTGKTTLSFALRSLNHYQHTIMTIENIVVVILVAFFTLALRRKYKRQAF